MSRSCKSCAFLVEDGDRKSCQVVNPGATTEIDDDEDMVCPKWEKRTLKSVASDKRKRTKEDIILYNIIK